MTPESLRQAFEAWAKSQCLPTYRWSSDGPYGSITQSAWVAWQACYERMGQSQTIESAPTEGEFMVWIPATELWWPAFASVRRIFSNAHGLLNEEHDGGRVIEATHWMHLPPPPGEKL